jgi:hypothetical protein
MRDIIYYTHMYVGIDVGGALYPPLSALIPAWMKASKFKPTSASTDHCDNYGSIG